MRTIFLPFSPRMRPATPLTVDLISSVADVSVDLRLSIILMASLSSCESVKTFLRKIFIIFYSIALKSTCGQSILNYVKDCIYRNIFFV